MDLAMGKPPDSDVLLRSSGYSVRLLAQDLRTH